tara:strand:- start:216 stop:422 length:207 start_codon:yes stop_codon:yes gene_type:complete
VAKDKKKTKKNTIKIIMCSQCNEEFATGYDYRMHWEKHLEDYLKHGIDYARKKAEKIKGYPLARSGST